MNIKKLFKKHKLLFSVIILMPLLIAIAMYFPALKFAKGSSDAWLSFWGSYLGGIFSGLLTLLGVYYAFKLQKEENITKELFLRYNELFEVLLSTERLIVILDNEDMDFDKILLTVEEIRRTYQIYKHINIEWYKKFRDILTEFDYIKAKDSKEIIEIRKNLIKLHKEVLGYVKVNDFNK